MITEAVITSLLDLMTWLLQRLPSDSLVWPSGSDWSTWLGANAGGLNTLLPLDELATVAYWSVTLVMPVVLSIRVTLFIWFLLPVVK